jgi:DNA-binding SARP family transcriptional activator
VKFATTEHEELKLNSRKSRALLAVLIMEADRWVSREKLASLLWSDRGTKQARNSLNQALYEIRRAEVALGTNLIERESERVRLISCRIDSDLFRFKGLLETDPLAASEFAVGELLTDLGILDGEFVDWLNRKRVELSDDLAAGLRRLADDAMSTNRVKTAISANQRILEMDPIDEPARRQLMDLHIRDGNRAEAMRQYQICKELLATELGVPPDPSRIYRAPGDGRTAR